MGIVNKKRQILEVTFLIGFLAFFISMIYSVRYDTSIKSIEVTGKYITTETPYHTTSKYIIQSNSIEYEFISPFVGKNIYNRIEIGKSYNFEVNKNSSIVGLKSIKK